MLEKCGRPDSNVFHIKYIISNHGNWKNQNPGGRFGTTSLIAMPIQPIYLTNWADYSYEVKNSEIWAPAFFKHNNSFIATVRNKQYKKGIESRIADKIVLHPCKIVSGKLGKSSELSCGLFCHFLQFLLKSQMRFCKKWQNNPSGNSHTLLNNIKT